MTDRDVVERAASMLDAAVMEVRPKKSHWKMTYAVRINGPRAVVWMKRLRPLMGVRRRAQIDRAIASYAPDPRKDVAERMGTSIWSIYDLRLGRTYAHLPRPA